MGHCCYKYFCSDTFVQFYDMHSWPYEIMDGCNALHGTRFGKSGWFKEFKELQMRFALAQAMNMHCKRQNAKKPKSPR